MTAYFIYPPHKVMFTRVHKCGTHSTKYLILREADLIPEYGNAWQPKLLERYTIKKPAAKKCADYTHIHFVRNPYKRFVSAYVYFFLRGLMFPKGRLKMVKDMLAEYNNNPTFENVVAFITSFKDPKKIDQHFRPQHLSYFPQGKEVHVIKLDKDIDKLNTLLRAKGFKNQFINYQKEIKKDRLYYERVPVDFKVHQKNWDFFIDNYLSHQKVPDYEAFYTDELKKKIYNYFKKDFIKFNYPK